MLEQNRALAAHNTALLTAALLAASLPCFGQQQAQSVAPPQAPTTAEQQQKKGREKQKSKPPEPGTSNDRLFYTLPDFLTVRNENEPPLSAREKFAVVARGSFDYVEYVWNGALAGIGQAQDSEPGYGQGAAGYGKRYGAALADGTIENFMTAAILPSLLHQDPRFYQSGQGTFWHRTAYAMSRIVITRSDSGHAQFNFSEVFGSALSAGISTYSYHPRADRTLSNAASVWGSQIGYDTLTLVAKEFWPDIRRKLSHKRSGDEGGR